MAQDLGTATKIKRPAHARLGPSGAHRWLYCAGSVNAEKGLDDTSGKPAAEGIAFHEWAADCAEFGLEPSDLYGATMHVPGAWKTDRDGLPFRAAGFDFTMDDEFGRHMHAGLARIRELAEPEGVFLFVETVVDTSRWLGEGQFGTADIIIVDTRLREITIFDWKFGRGVPVGAQNNSQLKLYALGVLAFLDERGIAYDDTWSVRTIIEQPRHVKGGGEWTTTVEELLVFGEWARERALATHDPDAPRTAGPEQCEFCKAKGRCETLHAYLYETVQSKFDEEAAEIDAAQALPQVHEITVEQRIAIWRNTPLFEKFFKAVHASLMLDWSHGDPPPGLKMVAGRKGRREYDPAALPAIEETLVEALEAEAWQEPKLISPATAEKKLGKKTYAEKLARFVRQGDGKPALVEANDERPALATVDEKFGDDEDDEFFD